MDLIYENQKKDETFGSKTFIYAIVATSPEGKKGAVTNTISGQQFPLVSGIISATDTAEIDAINKVCEDVKKALPNDFVRVVKYQEIFE